MRKIFLAIICTFLVTFIVCIDVTNANAEELTSEDVSIVNDETIADDNETPTNEENSLNKWFTENLGWIFGLPLGAMLTALCEILALSKKAKDVASTIKNNTDLKDKFTEEIEIFKDIVTNAKVVTEYTNDSFKKISTKLGIANANIDKIAHSFNTLNDNLGTISNRLDTLEKTICIIAQNDENLVANGVSGNITRLLESRK